MNSWCEEPVGNAGAPVSGVPVSPRSPRPVAGGGMAGWGVVSPVVDCPAVVAESGQWYGTVITHHRLWQKVGIPHVVAAWASPTQRIGLLPRRNFSQIYATSVAQLRNVSARVETAQAGQRTLRIDRLLVVVVAHRPEHFLPRPHTRPVFSILWLARLWLWLARLWLIRLWLGCGWLACG